MSDSRETILKLAREIALVAPMRQTKYTVCATVPWDLVHELRTALAEEGFDWLAAHKRYKAKIAEANAERIRKLYGPKTG